MYLRSLPAALSVFAVALLLFPRSAWAWVEMHTIGHDVRVEMSRQGSATVDHTLTLKVAGGPLRTFDLKIADKNVRLTEETFLTAAKDGITSKEPIPVNVEQRPDGDLRLEIDGKRGVGRGLYEIHVKYEVDLLQQESVRRDGTMLRVTWVGPSFADGVDNVRCTFAVPSSPTEPRLADDTRIDGQPSALLATAGTFLTTLQRGPQFDEITLTRPHVARLEAVAWSVRVDPRAMGDVGDPRLRAPAATLEQPSISTERRILVLALCVLAAALLSGLVALKDRQVSQAAKSVGLQARALLPIGLPLRVLLAGPALVGGIALQVLRPTPFLGALVVLIAVGLIAYRSPKALVLPRGPGRWLPLSEADALSTKKSFVGWLDASTKMGMLSFGLSVLLTVALGYAVYRYSPYHAHLVGLNAVALLALFGTGMCSKMPVPGSIASGEMLAKISSGLRRNSKSLKGKVKAIGRFPIGCSKPDEVRLLVTPRPALQGLIAVEVGVAWIDGSGGSVGLPEVLVRVHESSECHEQLTQKYPNSRWVRGRDNYERVLCLSPVLPLVEHTIATMQGLLKAIQPHAACTKKDQPEQKKPVRARSSRKASATMAGLPLQESW